MKESNEVMNATKEIMKSFGVGFVVMFLVVFIIGATILYTSV